MNELIFIYNGKKYFIGCHKRDKIGYLCKKFINRIGLDIYNKQFLLNGEKVKGKMRYLKLNPKIIYVQDTNINLIEENEVNNLDYDILNNYITIIYKINEKGSRIKIFGYDFVENNKEKCFILYKNEKYNLCEYLTNKFKLNDILMIKLVGINNIKIYHVCFRNALLYYLYLIYQD